MSVTQTTMISACLAILVFIAVIVTANALNLGSLTGSSPLAEQQKTDSALRNVIASSLNYIHTADESRSSLTVPLHGVQLGTNQFILLYDSTPYAVKGHIALSMPCDVRNPQAPLFHILVGRAPDLAPAPVGYLSQLSSPPNTCVYHSQFGFGDPVTDVVLKNISNRTLSLSGPHSVTITTHESYIPAAPSVEEMQMLKMSKGNATK
jgi:hypothetical protein